NNSQKNEFNSAQDVVLPDGQSDEPMATADESETSALVSPDVDLSATVVESVASIADNTSGPLTTETSASGEPFVVESVVTSVESEASFAPNAECETVVADDGEPSAASAEDLSTEKRASVPTAPELQELLSRIADMKVAELRAELERRGARLKGNLKKAD